MPVIQWAGLPPALRDQLFERAAEQRIRGEDLLRLQAWRRTKPDRAMPPRVRGFNRPITRKIAPR